MSAQVDVDAVIVGMVRGVAGTDLDSTELRERAFSARAAVAALIAERDALAQEVERLQGDGVHTCGPHCRRIACVLRRERDALLDALETLAEHFEYYMGDHECRPLENARAALARAQGVQS